MRVEIINDLQLYEGIVAAIVFPILKFVFLDKLFLNRYLTTSLAWFLTWICRRFITNFALAYKKEYGTKIKDFFISIPV